jgi:crotonobetainyl-CoA:carnitine CoA-transferase CaiB-like acyl-CoA transferase
MSVTGLPDGVPGGGPMKTGPSISDFIAGQYATTGVIAALYERDTFSGEGQHIDIALLDCTIAAQAHYVATYLTTGIVPQRRGTEGNGGLPSQAFECADRSIVVICGSEAQYRSFCEVLQHPELADDPRFCVNAKRLAHRADLAATFNALTRTWQSDALLSALAAAGVPGAPIYTYPEMFADPQVVQREMTFEAEHVQGGAVKFCSNPIRFTGVRPRAPMAPPVLGQHTEQVLREVLRLDETAIADLRTARVI